MTDPKVPNVSNLFRQDQKELTDIQKHLVRVVKNKADELMAAIVPVFDYDTRAVELARIKLEECVMWATKGITR